MKVVRKGFGIGGRRGLLEPKWRRYVIGVKGKRKYPQAMKKKKKPMASSLTKLNSTQVTNSDFPELFRCSNSNIRITSSSSSSVIKEGEVETEFPNLIKCSNNIIRPDSSISSSVIKEGSVKKEFPNLIKCNNSVIGSDSSISSSVVEAVLKEISTFSKKCSSDIFKSSCLCGVNPFVICKGDVIDLNEILFTPNRDYLVKPDGTLVKVDQLIGKTFIICTTVLEEDSLNDDLVYDLMQVYRQLEGTGCFEVVLVIAGGAHEPRVTIPEEITPSYLTKELDELFSKIHSSVPWSAIPYSDRHARQHLRQRLVGESNTSPYIIIINPRGKVLDMGEYAETLIRIYGAEGFPFTPKRIRKVDDHDEAALQGLSLEKLLTSPNRNFVISNDGKKVPICTLEHTFVGFFFGVDAGWHPLLYRVKEVYEELKARGDDFEIVFINLDFKYNNYMDEVPESERLFGKAFKTMPWLALPFRDPSCRRLHRIFGDPDRTRRAILPIIGPGGSSIEIYGFDIIVRYGIQAYPFTQEKVIEIEMRALLNLRLATVLSSTLHTVLCGTASLEGNDGSQVHVSTLLGKRVLLFLVNHWRFKTTKFLKRLEAKYRIKKGTAEEFEVVYVPFKKEEAPLQRSVPWLVHPCGEHLAQSASQLLFKRDYLRGVGVVAFGPEGDILAKASTFHCSGIYKQGWSCAFPCITTDLKEATRRDVIKGYDWKRNFRDSCTSREYDLVHGDSY